MKVEDYLNSVSYAEDASYIPSQFSIEFVNFIKLVNGNEGEENKTPVLHYRMLDQIAKGEPRIANMIHRGAAKAIALDTELFLLSGSSVIKTKARDIKVGDMLIDREGNPTKVIAVSEIFDKPCYDIDFKNAGQDRLVVSEDHLNFFFDGKKEFITTLKEYVPPNLKNNKNELYAPLCKAWKIGTKKVERPYEMGFNSLYLENFFEYDYETRKAFFMGIMGKNGTITNKGFLSIDYEGKYDKDYITMLIHSLGGYVLFDANPILFMVGFCPFRDIELKRKYFANFGNPQRRHIREYARIRKITKKRKSVPTVCFKVDSPTESFTLANGVVTHNTTLFGEYLILYLAFMGGRLPGYKSPIKLALYVADSIDNGVKNMRKNLQYRYENSAFLQQVLKAEWTDIEWRFENKRGEKFIVKAYGAKSGVRGTKALGVRPQLAILDDLVSDEDARSPTVLQSIRDTVYKAVDYALHPTKNTILWLGTPFNANDPLYEAIESGTWAVNVFPVCEKFPCTKEEFRGSWEDRFPYEYVLKKYTQAKQDGKIETFLQELMLRIMSDDARLLTEDNFKWYSKDSLMKVRHNFNFYITTDFATSDRSTADLSVISVWAYNHNGDWFYVDGIAEQQDMGKNIDALFKLVSEYKPMEVGIEVTGQQGGFIPWINQEMMNRNIWFNLATSSNTKVGIRPTTDKMQRFNVVVPWFKAGKMYFPLHHDFHKGLQEMMEELRLASYQGFKSKHDDSIDTVSMLALLKTFKPSAEVAITNRGVFDTPEPVIETESYFV